MNYASLSENTASAFLPQLPCKGKSALEPASRVPHDCMPWMDPGTSKGFKI